MKLKKALKIFENSADIDIYSINNYRVPVFSGTPPMIREFAESLLKKKVRKIRFNTRALRTLIYIECEDENAVEEN